MQWRTKQDLDFLKNREIGATTEAEASAKSIIERVKIEGDKAIFDFTHQFDRVSLSALAVSKEELFAAYDKVEPAFVEAIREAAQHIKAFHEKQRVSSWMEEKEDGTLLGQKITPVDSVGLYIPGGSAPLPSSVLMAGLPAKVAGVERLVLASPPQADGHINPGVLVAAHEVGITECYTMGGAQAIAALAYGTESVRPVDKIVGPGNLYVTLAKKEVFGKVDIDSLAGPSEIVVLADETARPDWIASDLLSQAEHDPNAMSILITTDRALAEAVEEELAKQCEALPRKAIAAASIESNGYLFLVDSLEEGVDLINQIAPEHLEVVTKDPESLLPIIRHAGAIFLGAYSSEPVGDYFAGPNHIIPTNGTARYGSPLSVESFIKRSSIIRYSEQALKKNVQAITTLARFEGLEGHARAVEQRLKGGD